ncbi:MAG: DUF211 domain-containing protein [Candidatus Bathyarchaeia archaeon]
MGVGIKRLVVDALKPREISSTELCKELCKVKGVQEVDLVVVEVDVRTETIRITLKGGNIRYEDMAKTMDKFSAAIRSIDEITTHKS